MVKIDIIVIGNLGIRIIYTIGSGKTSLIARYLDRIYICLI